MQPTKSIQKTIKNSSNTKSKIFSNEQNLNIHLVRIGAILLVILNHASAWCQFYNVNQVIRGLYMSIATCGVPVFFIVSGSLLLSKYNEPIGNFFKKRFDKIGIPFLAWSYIYLFYQKYVPLLPWQRSIAVENISFNPLILLDGPTYGHLWFIYSLVSLYLVIPILRRICKDTPNDLLYYLIIVLFLGTIQQFLSLALGKPVIFEGTKFYIMVDYTIYLLIGFIFTQTKFKSRLTTFTSFVLFVFGFVLIFVPTYIAINNSAQQTELFIAHTSPIVMLTSLGFFGVLLNMDIPGRLNRMIISIGDASFGIFLIHPIFLYVLTLIKFPVKNIFQIAHPLITIPLVVTICFIASYIIIVCLKKTPYLNKIV